MNTLTIPRFTRAEKNRYYISTSIIAAALLIVMIITMAVTGFFAILIIPFEFLLGAAIVGAFAPKRKEPCPTCGGELIIMPRKRVIKCRHCKERFIIREQ